mmetsp:Transcript_62855/g.161800  ORF Transcript_62855/g.161800 Transcript_62855/m.161800 type:complete len:322 (-) Transcript_62855:113-1078(-)
MDGPLQGARHRAARGLRADHEPGGLAAARPRERHETRRPEPALQPPGEVPQECPRAGGHLALPPQPRHLAAGARAGARRRPRGEGAGGVRRAPEARHAAGGGLLAALEPLHGAVDGAGHGGALRRGSRLCRHGGVPAAFRGRHLDRGRAAQPLRRGGVRQACGRGVLPGGRLPRDVPVDVDALLPGPGHGPRRGVRHASEHLRRGAGDGLPGQHQRSEGEALDPVAPRRARGRQRHSEVQAGPGGAQQQPDDPVPGLPVPDQGAPRQQGAKGKVPRLGQARPRDGPHSAPHGFRSSSTSAANRWWTSARCCWRRWREALQR